MIPPRVIIERDYNHQYLIGDFSVDKMIDKLTNVSKEDVLRFTRKVKLQALLFFGGKINDGIKGANFFRNK